MHIVIDARIISSTTGRYVERLLHYLETLDTINTYTVLVRQKDATYWRPTNPNFRTEIADFAPYSFAEQIGLLKQLNALKADLVHFTAPHQPILYKGVKVTTIHDLTLLKTYNSDKNWIIYHLKQLVGRFVFWRVARTSRHIITDANFTRQEIMQKWSINKNSITSIYLAGEVRSTKQKTYPLPSRNFILYVGQQSDYKNIKRLGEAHQKLLETHPDLHLVLAGKIDAAAGNNKMYFESKKYRQIIFTGFVEDEELNWLYQNARSYVFSSLMEGFGLPGLEAMANKLPVASSNATCLPEVYGDAAIYFDPLDTDAMARAIGEILDNNALYETLIEKGLQQVQKYSWEKTARETLAVYEKVLGISTNSSER